MAPSTTETLSFSPWSRDTNEEGSLKDVLARVNFERGHFRTITEASLQEEIATEGALELSESEDDDENDEDDQDDAAPIEGKPTTRAELYKAKQDMLGHVSAAEVELGFVVDFMSLLVSKDVPGPARTTMSSGLRKEIIPDGTLGVDMWQRMPVDKSRETQEELLATNVRLNSLQKSADSLLSTAKALNDNVKKETEYWNQVLSISQQGWNVSRIRGTQHKLGVHFGFSESSPEFYRKGMAALHATPDGTVVLDRGIGSQPKSLRVVLRRNGEVVGASKVPVIPDAAESTLEARIRYARDSLFDEELFHEMIRESRTLASLGIGMKGSAITFASQTLGDAGVEVSFELVNLDEDHTLYTNGAEGDNLAQGIVLAARLLLSKAHRDRLKKRSEIPPPLSSDKKDERPLLPILRPVIAFIIHRTTLDQLNSYLDTTTNLLNQAQITASSTPAYLELSTNPATTTIDDLTTQLIQPWISTTTLTISPPDSDSSPFTINLKVETTLAHRTGPIFTFSTPTVSGRDGHRLESLDEVISAVDDEISSYLAVALAPVLENENGSGWQCNEREGLLLSSPDVEDRRRVMRVRFRSEPALLALSSGAEKRVWRLEGSSEERSFWDRGRELAGAG